jgi:outer membrane protein TolC
MHKTRLLLLAAALPATVSSVSAISERDAVIRALEENSGIKIQKIRLEYDSLALESAKSAWLPAVNLSARGDLTPVDTAFSKLSGGVNERSSALSAEAGVVQTIPGGGVVAANAGAGITSLTDSDTAVYGHSMGISLVQPLLKGAWKNGDVCYSVKLSGINHETMSLSRKKAVLASISAIRNLYWDSYERQSLCGVYAAMEDYAARRMESARVRFRIGTVTGLDTLSALLSHITASRQLLEATSASDIAKQNLAVELATSADAAIPDTALPVIIESLPSPETFLENARRFDPSLSVFETAARKIEIEMARAKNQMLPSLNLEAGYSLAGSGDRFGSGKYSYSGNAVVSLVAGYSIPAKSRRMTIKQEALSARENEILKEQYERELSAEIYELARKWKLETKTLEMAAAAADVARRQYSAAEAGYNLGTVDRLAVLEAENQYLDASVQLIRRRVAMKRLEIIFDEITGEVLNRFGVKIE